MPETKFLTLFVPQEDWFQDFLRRKSKEFRKRNLSLSAHLVALILTDLQRKNLLTAHQEKEIESLEPMRPKRISKEQRVRFSLYLPPQVRDWLPPLLREVAPRPGLSVHCWKLFVEAHRTELSEAERASWENYQPGRGTRDAGHTAKDFPEDS